MDARKCKKGIDEIDIPRKHTGRKAFEDSSSRIVQGFAGSDKDHKTKDIIDDQWPPRWYDLIVVVRRLILTPYFTVFLKPSKPANWGEDVKATHRSMAKISHDMTEGHPTRVRTSSTSNTVVKGKQACPELRTEYAADDLVAGILKPPKQFADDDFNKPVIPCERH